MTHLGLYGLFQNCQVLVPAAGSILDGIGCQILLDHQGNLEDDGVIELPQIQTGELLDLLQPVNQGIAVYEQLSGSFRYIQIVFKELLDGEQSLLIQALDGTLLEYFLEEHFTQVVGS